MVITYLVDGYYNPNSQRSSALNVNRWGRADSEDLADEEMGVRLLDGVQRSWRSRCVSLFWPRLSLASGMGPL